MFAAELARRRAELELTQTDIAERTGLSATYIRTLESGGANPSYSTMLQIASALSVTLRELIESMETGRATLAEVARLFDGTTTVVQHSILDVLRSVAAARDAAAGRRRSSRST